MWCGTQPDDHHLHTKLVLFLRSNAFKFNGHQLFRFLYEAHINMSWVHRMNKRDMFSSVYTSIVCEVIERVLHVIYILHASITTWNIHIDCIWFTDPFLVRRTRNHDDVLHQFVFVFWFCMCKRASERAFARGNIHIYLCYMYSIAHATVLFAHIFSIYNVYYWFTFWSFATTS